VPHREKESVFAWLNWKENANLKECALPSFTEITYCAYQIAFCKTMWGVVGHLLTKIHPLKNHNGGERQRALCQQIFAENLSLYVTSMCIVLRLGRYTVGKFGSLWSIRSYCRAMAFGKAANFNFE